MLNYALGRMVVAAILVWVVVTIVFSILHVIPGDPAELLSSSGSVSAPPETVEALRHEMGLDRPILEQYTSYILGILKGDLGKSFLDGYSVSQEIAKRLPRTLELIIVSTLFAIFIGIPLGSYAARHQNRLPDRIVSWIAGLQISAPVFVIGTLLVLVFAQKLRWLPAGGFVPFTDDPVKHLIHLSMPVVTIAIGFSGTVFRMMRASAIETLQRDWVRTARAKGLSREIVNRRHIIRNSLGPVLTVVGLNVGSLLGGTVLVEFVFNWPGLSGFLVSAVEQRDYPSVQGIIIVVSCLFILINLCVDLLYSVLDPRITYNKDA